MSRFIYFVFLVFMVSFVATGCMIVRAPTVEELRALDQPPMNVATKVEKFLPMALKWYEEVEAQMLPQGRPLSESEKVVARKLGVLQPERVRIVVLEKFPMPENQELRVEAERYGIGSFLEGGRTFGYAIMLKPRYAETSTIITHELAHVGQHDRLGRVSFVRRYITELEMMGYTRSPLELDAYQKQSTTK